MASAPGRTLHAAGGTGARPAAVEGMLFGVAQPMDEAAKKATCQQKFDDLANMVDTIHGAFKDLQDAEREGLIGPPAAVQIKGPRRNDRYVVSPGQEVEVKVGKSTYRCSRPGRGGNGRGEEVEAPEDNNVFFLARVPHAYMPEDMRYSQTILQRVRDGFGPEEQGELVCPTSYYQEVDIGKRKHVIFHKRQAHDEHVGAVGAEERQTGQRRNQQGIRTAVREVIGFASRIANGFKGAAFRWLPLRRPGAADPRDGRAANTKARAPAAGDDLQPHAPDLQANDVVGKGTRRVDPAGQYLAPAVFDGNVPTFGQNAVAKVQYGPETEEEASAAAMKTIALLNETVNVLAAQAPKFCPARVQLEAAQERVRNKTVLEADSIMRGR